MEWQLRVGDNENRLERLSELGVEIKELDDKPDISGLEWIWDGFWKLSTCRELGMGVGPIPWWTIELYGRREGLDWEEMQHFEYCISILDSKYLDYHQQDKPHGDRKKSS